MRVLLVLPHHRLENYGYISRRDSDFPLGLGYVAAVLERHFQPAHMAVFDFQLLRSDMAAFRRVLQGGPFDLIGFSVFTPTIEPAVAVAREVGVWQPQAHLLAGGPHCSLFPGDVIRRAPEVHAEVTGEAEQTLPELVEALIHHRPLGEVAGIVYRDGNRIVETPRRPLIGDLDAIPFPKRELFPLYDYMPLPGQYFKKPILPMLASRGCPYRCRFCEDRVLWQNKARFRGAENIVAEMNELVERWGAREIKFFDDTFTASKRRAAALCELILQRRLKVIWRVCTRVDRVDQPLLNLMHRAGLRSINFGVESGSERILIAMNKGFDKPQVRKAVAESKRARVETKASFILNYPGEDRRTVEETIGFAHELDLDYVGFNMFNPLMSPEMKTLVEENYPINEVAWNGDNARAVNKVFFHQSDLDEDYLAQAYQRAMRSHYLRPRNILRALGRIRNWDMVKSYWDGFRRLIGLKLARAGDAAQPDPPVQSAQPAPLDPPATPRGTPD